MKDSMKQPEENKQFNYAAVAENVDKHDETHADDDTNIGDKVYEIYKDEEADEDDVPDVNEDDDVYAKYFMDINDQTDCRSCT